MEAFEHVVKAYMESQGYIVSTNVKFPVKLRTRKTAYPEFQTHGYEIDIVATREGFLILGSVKSFLGSYGVSCKGFRGLSKGSSDREYNQYRIFNDREVREGVIQKARERYGYYPRKSIQVKLFVGKFKSKKEQWEIEEHLAFMKDRGVSFEVVGLDKIVQGLVEKAQESTYINDPVIMTVNALDAAGLLTKN